MTEAGSDRDCPSEPCGQNRCEFVCLHSERILQLLLFGPLLCRTDMNSGVMKCQHLCAAVEATQLDPEVSTKVLSRLFCERQHISSLEHKDSLSLQPVSSCCDRTIQTQHKTRTPHFTTSALPVDVCCARDVLLRDGRRM